MTGQRKRRGLTGAALATVGLAPLLFAGAASAAAQPATLSVDKGCYVFSTTRPVMTITGAGYPAGAQILVSDKFGIDETTTANAAGQIAVTVKAPPPIGLRSPGMKIDPITAEGDDPTTGAQYKGTTTADISAIAALHGATKKRPGLQAFGERTKWAFSGFPHKTVYGHFTYHSHLVATEKFGKTKGACGILKVKRKLLPVRAHHQSYTVQIDTHRKFHKKTKPQINLKLALSVF